MNQPDDLLSLLDELPEDEGTATLIPSEPDEQPTPRRQSRRRKRSDMLPAKTMLIEGAVDDDRPPVSIQRNQSIPSPVGMSLPAWVIVFFILHFIQTSNVLPDAITHVVGILTSPLVIGVALLFLRLYKQYKDQSTNAELVSKIAIGYVVTSAIVSLQS